MVKMSQEIMIRVARDEDAADLARIYAYYVNETAVLLNTRPRMYRNGKKEKDHLGTISVLGGGERREGGRICLCS